MLLAAILITFSAVAAQADNDPGWPALPAECAMHLMLAQAGQDMDSDSFGPPRPPFGDGGLRGMRGQQKHLEQFRILKLLEFLDIQADQETEFITLFRHMRRQQRDYDLQRRDLLDTLTVRLERDSSDNKEILELVDKVTQLQFRQQEAKTQFMDKVRLLLTPRQLGRAVVFQERFELQLLEKLRGFHQRGGMQKGMDRDAGRRPDGDRPKKDR
jgi:Spy/CpxP family protein refolding chaperone